MIIIGFSSFLCFKLFFQHPFFLPSPTTSINLRLSILLFAKTKNLTSMPLTFFTSPCFLINNERSHLFLRFASYYSQSICQTQLPSQLVADSNSSSLFYHKNVLFVVISLLMTLCHVGSRRDSTIVYRRWKWYMGSRCSGEVNRLLIEISGFYKLPTVI